MPGVCAIDSCSLFKVFLLQLSSMNARIASVLLLAVAAAVPGRGQLAAPNAAGASLGHIHLYVSDVAAQQKFWATMGGVPVANQKLQMIQFSGVFILVRGAETKGGPAGSIVNHFGFVWQDLPAAIAKWKAEGYKIEQEEDPNHGFVLGPDGIRLEFSGDPSLKVPVAISHIHLYPQDVPAMQAWYEKILGGVPGKRAVGGSRESVDCVDVPGAILAMSHSDTKLDPTAGRSLDHIGFEVKDLAATIKRLEADGVTINMQPRDMTKQIELKIAFVTDPNGTYIEVTEGLAAK
jgi:catechol 2,3-dioxygenase-like lactoylglutathione lyase family enzyme